jgi:tetratricopeptide (TPR) repeat protein
MAMLLAKLILLAGMALPLPAQTSSARIATHAQAAQEAERQNDFATAVHQYEYVVNLLPRNAEMQSNLGVALYFNHEWTRATTVFGRAIAQNPNLFVPHLFSGLAWYHLSNPDAAAPELEKAVHINPSDVTAHIWLGYANVDQFRYEAAVGEFQTASRLQPDNMDAWYALGQSYLQIGKDRTIELLAIAPNGARVWQLAGEQCQLRGDRQTALADFDEASERRPDIPELRTLITQLGGTVAVAPSNRRSRNLQEDELYQQAHDAEQSAQAAFEHVVQIAPSSYRAHQIMAVAFAAKKQPDQAVEEYREVLTLQSDLPGIHEAIGNILVANAKTAEALKEFEAELQIQPHSAAAHTDAGRTLLLMGRDDDAARMLTQALQMDRPPMEVYVLLGKLDLRRKDYPAAIKMLTHYVSTTKDNSTAYYLLSQAYRSVGDKIQTDRAIELYRKTSLDARQRTQAQREIERLESKGQEQEDAVDSKETATH